MSERQRFTLSKIFAVIRLNHKHLSNFYCRKRIFSRGTKRNNSSSEALSFFLDGFHADGGDFLPSKPFFNSQGKWRILQTVLVPICNHLSCFSLPLTTTVDWTFSQVTRRNYHFEIVLLGAWTRPKTHARTPRNHWWGQPDGLCRKEKWPRRHTSERKLQGRS
jgi:hypothetical protein